MRRSDSGPTCGACAGGGCCCTWNTGRRPCRAQVPWSSPALPPRGWAPMPAGGVGGTAHGTSVRTPPPPAPGDRGRPAFLIRYQSDPAFLRGHWGGQPLRGRTGRYETSSHQLPVIRSAALARGDFMSQARSRPAPASLGPTRRSAAMRPPPPPPSLDQKCSLHPDRPPPGLRPSGSRTFDRPRDHPRCLCAGRVWALRPLSPFLPCPVPGQPQECRRTAPRRCAVPEFPTLLLRPSSGTSDPPPHL